MARALYLDTSAVLRAVVEEGTTPGVERSLQEARVLLTSRFALVESARALVRLRVTGAAPEARLTDVERTLAALWSRCEIWEVSPSVCAGARHVAPGRALRTLDALHLATFLLARRRIQDLELLTVDERLRDAALGGG